MSFLYRPRSAIHVHQKDSKKSFPTTQLAPAIENVPQKRLRARTTSTMAAIRRVSSIFLSKKKPVPDLKLANSVTHHQSHTTVSFSSSSRDSISSEDDIRRPSGLGRAVSVMSNRSLPPSPFLPTSQASPYPTQDYQRMRALSSPHLQLFNTNKPRVKQKFTRASINDEPPQSLPLLPPPPPPISSSLTREVIVRILSYLSRGTIASCSQVSKPFAAAARYNLYNTLNFDTLSLLQLEELVVLLASRRDLTELVSTFICHKWPSFFISDCHCRGDPPTSYLFQQRDALLTATFTLVLERMTNITSLTLPAFDASLLSHHAAFGLRKLTFMNYTISPLDARALFSWLDGQTNISSLRFLNLEDVYIPIKNFDIGPHRNSISCGRPGTAPLTSFLIQPQSSSPPLAPTFLPSFSSPSLLPSLVELHATPSILTLFGSPPSSLPTPTPILRPLTTVSLNITTTLYTGLRPATLMNALRGISHLCLKFGRAVDRRTLEKVVGTAGGVLGGGKGGWIGLRSLELGFHDSPAKQSRRDEALYKALQISLPRYKSLRSLRLFVSHEHFVNDRQHHRRNGLSNTNPNPNDKDRSEPSGVELVLIDSWLGLCPSLEVITLFSGAQWRKELDDREERV